MGRPRVPHALRPLAAGAVVSVVVVTVVVTVAGSTAAAAPADSTTVSFEVVGTPGGGLHLSIGPEGGVMVPAGKHTMETVLPRAAVRDDRGGGAREWSATVGTTGARGSMTVAYKVAALRVPGTGSVFNRMPDWSPVHAAQEAVSAAGISAPSAVSGWEPHVRIDSHRSASGAGSAGSSGVNSSVLGSSGMGSGSSSGYGSSGPGTRPSRGAIITSVL